MTIHRLSRQKLECDPYGDRGRSLGLVLAGIALVGLLKVSTSAYATKGDPSPQEKDIKGAHELIKVLESDYFKGNPPTNWPSLRQEYLDHSRSLNTPEARKVAATQLLQKLGWSSHSLLDHEQIFFHGWRQLDGKPPATPRLWFPGWVTERRGARWYIKDIIPGTAASENQLLARGDEIQTINGIPFHGQSALPLSSGPLEVVLRRSAWDQPLRPHMQPVPEEPLKILERGSNLSRRIITTGGKPVAYLRLWSCEGERMVNLLRRQASELEKLSDAWILDLRGGLGGVSPMNPVIFTGDKTRKSPALYSKPLWILMDEQTTGSCEALAGSLKLQKRAILVGEPTAGLMGAEKRAYLGHENWLVRLPQAEVSPDLMEAFANGVTPDVPVRDPLIAGQGIDPVLEVALQEISRR